MKLIGIHHAGSSEMRKLNGKEGMYQANEGIRIRAILDMVSNQLI
ncbi:hypothetical protein [Paraflavitalea speifideaquila]|nr:hypothetical protein [Paraflavitalea speifideiaquila]